MLLKPVSYQEILAHAIHSLTHSLLHRKPLHGVCFAECQRLNDWYDHAELYHGYVSLDLQTECLCDSKFQNVISKFSADVNGIDYTIGVKFLCAIPVMCSKFYSVTNQQTRWMYIDKQVQRVSVNSVIPALSEMPDSRAKAFRLTLIIGVWCYCYRTDNTIYVIQNDKVTTWFCGIMYDVISRPGAFFSDIVIVMRQGKLP